MSAILLGTNIEERLQREENEIINKSKEFKEQFIEGKNKTYVISKTLGKGTFGKVKIAYNKDNKKEKYACKILLKSNIKDEDDSIRCKREMDILKRMHHVNVVRTYEIVSTDTTYYIFMDFCAKGELFNYIVKKRHLSEEKSAFFYYQLVNGIEYIHKKGVCHRDLKPENLLLTEKMKLKIIDFGLSNYFTGNLLETPCGSPCYASPEMVIGNKYNGFCIDIWSSGIILYAMLCGYLPFEEAENDEYNEILFRNIVECNIEYPTEFITPIAKDLLKKILVKDPRKRITIEEIKQHNFYLLGEILYKQTFESFGSLKEYELFYIEDKLDDNEKDEKENKYINSMKNNEHKEKKQNHKKNDILLSNKKEENKNKNITDNNKKEGNKNEVFNIEKNAIKNKGKDNDKKTGSQKEKEKENNNIINKTNLIVANLDKGKKEEKISPKKDNDKDRDSNKKEIKQLSLLNNNEDKLLGTDNQKAYYNSIDELFNLKLDKIKKEIKKFKEASVHGNFCPYLNYKQFNNINFNANYLNTEIYPKDTRNKNKINYYNFKLLNKKSLVDDKITLNNIVKTLQNQEFFKSKTPIGHSIINKAMAKKNALSNSNKKEKQKYNSHSPGFRRFAKINNIHFKIKNNLKYPRKNNFSVTNPNNSKNNYFLLNENIYKSFDPQKFFLKNNNKNIKPNKKFLAKDNNNNVIKRYSKSIKNSINTNNMNTFNKKKGKTISSAKINLEREKSKNTKNKMNLRNFECCLSSNCSKRKHPIIESNKNKFTGNFPSDNYNKNKNARNLSKKSLNKQKGANNHLSNLYINNYDTNKSNKNFVTNTEFRNNKIVSLGKNKINLSKLKLKNKNKKNKFYNLLSKNVNYINNKEDKDNIIINLNILKPNFILDRQKSSKKSINNKIGLNSNSINLNNNFNIINSKAERTRTESNFNVTMKNNNNYNYNYNFGNRGKNKNITNLVANQIKKSAEINKNIKSIQDMHKVRGSLSNNKRKIIKESKF